MNHKQGDSFDYLANIPADFTNGYFVGWTPTAQVRTTFGRLLSELDVSWVDPVTTRTIRLKKIDTATWPLGNAEFDVQFKRISDGYVLSTSTIALTVSKDVTKP